MRGRDASTVEGDRGGAHGHLARLGRGVVFGLLALGSSLLAQPPPATVPVASPDGNDYLIRVVGEGDGLMDLGVTGVGQDADGFLWVGTYNGLARFDGHSFEFFYPSNLEVMPDAAVEFLWSDRDGRIWCSTRKGMILKEGDAWVAVPLANASQDLYARSMTQSSDGTIYMTTFHDAGIFQYKEGQFLPLKRPNRDSIRFYDAMIGRNDRLWVLQAAFFGYYENDQWTSVRPMDAFDLSVPATLGGVAGRSGDLWTIDARYLRRFSGTEEVQRIPVPSDYGNYWSLYEDSAGLVWVATFGRGLFLCDPRTEEWTHYTLFNGVSYNNIRTVFEDREGSRWLASNGGGLIHFRPRNCKVYGVEYGLQEPVVRSVSLDSAGDLWAATWGQGLARFRNGRFEHEETAGLEGYYQTVLAGRGDRIWFSSYDRGLVEWRPDGSIPVTLPESIDGSLLYALHEDASGTFWGGYSWGVLRVVDGAFRIYREIDGSPANVRFIGEVPDSTGLYLGTRDQGLFRFVNGQFDSVDLGEGYENVGIRSVVAAEDGGLWIGSFQRGLLKHRSGHTWTLRRPTFEAESIGAIVRRGGDLWITSNRGIWRAAESHLDQLAAYPRMRFSGVHLGAWDGLSVLDCGSVNQPSYAVDPNGRFWFASRAGMVCLDPGSLQLNGVRPKVFVTQVDYIDQAGQRVVRSAESISERTIALPPDHLQLAVHFTSPVLAVPNKVRFQYTLTGPSLELEQWTEDREVAFHRLQPGSYQLSIRAVNNDGIMGPVSEAWRIEVAPPLWKTTEFRAMAFGGAILFFISLGSCVTRVRLRHERRLLEKERSLAAVRARLGLILENTPDFVGFFDPDQRLLYINPAGERLTGKGLGSRAGGYRLQDFHPDWAVERIISEGWPAALQSGVWLGETALLNREGEEIPVSQLITMHVNEAGDPDFASTIMRDVSELKSMEAQLRESQKMEAIGTLAGGIAHDFNNILTCLFGNLSFLKEFVPETGEAAECLDESLLAAERAKGLVRQILTYSRRTKEERGIVAMEQVVREALRLARSSLPATIEIVLEVESGIGPVRVSVTQIHQIVLNLATNAAHAMEHRGKIQIRLSEVETSHVKKTLRARETLGPERAVLLQVRDHGVGIPRDQQERIFDPFFTTREPDKGTGLGLSVVQGIVRSHGGIIRVESAVGEGTTLKIYLPCVSEPIPTAGPTKGSFDLKTGRGERVLLIDDEKSIAQMAARMLRRLGYRPTMLVSAREALELFESQPEVFDVVVTDFVMPEFRGDDVIHAIRERRRDLPIVLMSGTLDPEMVDSLSDLGPLGTIEKPFDESEIADVLHRLLCPDSGQGVASQ